MEPWCQIPRLFSPTTPRVLPISCHSRRLTTIPTGQSTEMEKRVQEKIHLFPFGHVPEVAFIPSTLLLAIIWPCGHTWFQKKLGIKVCILGTQMLRERSAITMEERENLCLGTLSALFPLLLCNSTITRRSPGLTLSLPSLSSCLLGVQASLCKVTTQHSLVLQEW